MGTQQILLIVLSVIIVGAAIAVGIQMFNSQSYSANKSAIAADAQSYATQVIQYYKTPLSQGGAGGEVPDDDTGEGAATSEAKIGGFLGWVVGTGVAGSATPWAASTYGTSNENGYYYISDITPGATGSVKIIGVGAEERNSLSPKIETTISFPDGDITAVASDVATGSGS